MIDNERLIHIYKTMVKIRKFEEKAIELFSRNLTRGSMHLYIGEEAIASTVCSLLKDTDYITSTHRGHGHAIAKGADLKGAFGELLGRATGLCQGRGGSMHICEPEKGNLGANAIVGGGIPIATGAGLAAKLKGTDQVAVAFFGDGASNQGTFHESINLASVWKLPVIYVCENNGYGISVPVKESTSVKDISVRAVAYDIPGITVDGNDVFAINDAMENAISRARAGEGPSLIECKTSRWMGHWQGDPQNYRPKGEIESWKQKCPIQRVRTYMINNNILTPEKIKEIEDGITDEVNEAAEYAINSPQPDPSRVLEHVYVD